MTSRRRQPEAQLQRAVLDHLAWRAVPGAWWCHYPAGGWRSPIEAAILKSLGTVAGVPDLLIVHRGQLYALELKTKYGRLTQTQIDTQARMRAAGATVATAVEIDAALAQLEQWQLLRPNISNQIGRAFEELRRM
jgi:hemin uptake protein HemP